MAHSVDQEGSDEVREMFCEHCDLDGKYALAEGFCATCEDYMCKVCIKYHAQYKNDHTIISKDEMPTDICFDTCSKHSNKLIKFYCECCSDFACLDCKLSKKKSDEKTFHQWQHLPMLVEHLENNNLHRTTVKSLDEINKTLHKIQERVDLNKQTNGTYFESATNALRKQTLKCQQSLSEIEQGLKESTREEKSKNTSKIKDICKNVETLTLEIKSIENDIEHKKELGQKASLFILLVQNKQKIMQIGKKLDTLDTENNINVYQLEPTNAELSSKNVGTFSVAQENRKFNVETQVVPGIEIPNLKKIMLPGDVDGICLVKVVFLVIVSYFCKKIKVFEVGTHKELFSYSTSEEPFGVTSLNNDQIAVSLHNKKSGWIYVFSVSDTGHLTKVSEIYTDTACRGLAQYNDSQIILAHTHPVRRINIMHLSGKVLNFIGRTENGNQTFGVPIDIVLSPDKKVMYVTDLLLNMVIMMNIKGETVQMYKDDDLKNPRGITVDDDGLLYVCGYKTNNIHILTPDLQKITVVRKVPQPISILYNSKNKILYVGLQDCTTIKRFRITKAYSR